MEADLLIAGTEVTLRGLRWQVVRTEDHEGGHRLRLRGLGAAVLGEEIDIVPEIESVAAIRHEVDPERAGRLRDWLLYHQAFILEQSLGPNALLAVQPGRLEMQPYQLVPVVRAIEMSRVRLLLADGVGLGKTIQAGLILAELMARRLAQRVLVVSPAGPLLDQWRTEMQDRFGLRLLEIDRIATERIRKQVELGANPFDHAHLAIASIDYLKQERVLAELERTSYDVVIIDEAHHCVDLGGAGVRDDSLRRRLADVLAGRCDTLLLLTATPHDGFDRSFASLCELLDPSLVDGRGTLRGERYRQYVIRRLKRHILDPKTNKRIFPERQVVPHRIVVDSAERPRFVELSQTLLAMVAPELRRALRAKRYDDLLSFFALLKRSVSTVAACRGTLQVVLDRFRAAVEEREESQEARRERLRTLRDARRRLDRFGVATADEEADIQDLELEDIAQQLAGLERETRADRRRLTHQRGIAESLEHLVELAHSAEAEDPKIDAVATEIGAIRAEEPDANVLVYTEYTTSQDVLVERLKSEGYEVLMLRGGGDMGTKGRKEATQRFSTQSGLIMVCTDAAAEGLNLHYKCHHLIHLELPFNPNRLEQRNGRIDRYGQTKNPIVRYLHLAGTFEENILLRLIAKYERQRAKLTYVPNTLGLTASPEERSRRLLQGIIDTEDTLFADQAPSFTLLDGDPSDGAEDSVRELLDEIDRSFGAFEKAAKTNDWLADAGLNADIETARRAGEIRLEGGRAALVDLPSFVVDAVLRDGGRIEGRVKDKTFELRLPGTWAIDLDEMPGAEQDSRTVRLTTDKDIVIDEDKRLVGFVGRAHPLVRHAIDRVRYSSIGEAGAGEIDHRASAVKVSVPAPLLVCTYLGRILSGQGRELERVIAVTLSAENDATFTDDLDAWMRFANRDKAISASGVWEEHFASWAEGRLDEAKRVAAEGFAAEADITVTSVNEAIDRERAELDRWLSDRATELSPAAKAAEGPDLFTADADEEPAAPPATPAEQLETIRRDQTRPDRVRSSADAVLKLCRDRLKRLDARSRISEPDVVPLGILMVIPEDEHGA